MQEQEYELQVENAVDASKTTVGKWITSVGTQTNHVIALTQPVLVTRRSETITDTQLHVSVLQGGRQGHMPAAERNRIARGVLQGKNPLPQKYHYEDVPVINQNIDRDEYTERVIPRINLGIFLSVTTETYFSPEKQAEQIELVRRAVAEFIKSVQAIPSSQVTEAGVLCFVQIERMSDTELRQFELTTPKSDARNWSSGEIDAVVQLIQKNLASVQSEVLSLDPDLSAEDIELHVVGAELRNSADSKQFLSPTLLSLPDLEQGKMYAPPMVCAKITTDHRELGMFIFQGREVTVANL